MFKDASPILPRFRSKTVATALAFFFGSLGAHRFYLYGLRDIYGWAHLVSAAVAGMWGIPLLISTERGSLLGWILSTLGMLSVLSAFLSAIIYGLCADQKWDNRFNTNIDKQSRSGWTVVLLVIFSLFIGAFLLMGELALMFQTYFESQM